MRVSRIGRHVPLHIGDVDGRAATALAAGHVGQFATTFRFSPRGVMRRPLFAGLFGAAGGPIAFLAGERLGAVILLPPLAHGLLQLSLSWAIALLALSAIVGRLGGGLAELPRTLRWPADPCGASFWEPRSDWWRCCQASVESQRFKEPLHESERSRSDTVRPQIAGEVRLLQEVDIGSSAEVTLDARLTQLSAHEKNRCLLRYEPVGSAGGNSSRAPGSAGTISGTVLGTAGFLQVKASRILGFSSR
jgi:hypothetical protein